MTPNLCAILFSTIAVLAACSVEAFTVPTTSTRRSTSSRSRLTTALNVFGPKQALAIEKAKNPAKFEATVEGLMSTKGLTRGQAEKRYGEFLIDPDGFALQAAEQERREKGYKDWVEQAVAKSDNPEATRKRIEEFTKRNQIKGTAIMVAFSAAVLSFSYANPYVPN
eukprot:CAMPEP_0181045946 /NCGR_PEP_ID=MMETSP1070-20121207/14084_1 /TAXON_ID=265543 /ORGANISM="Minutocellus polymorphus, Strain NH13" /LENGTH=166 /DNA_ID=CAMNT_0023124519 /DNA_START=64 /DNA_END=564 /DNA_ORIENTATION=+